MRLVGLPLPREVFLARWAVRSSGKLRGPNKLAPRSSTAARFVRSAMLRVVPWALWCVENPSNVRCSHSCCRTSNRENCLLPVRWSPLAALRDRWFSSSLIGCIRSPSGAGAVGLTSGVNFGEGRIQKSTRLVFVLNKLLVVNLQRWDTPQISCSFIILLEPAYST